MDIREHLSRQLHLRMMHYREDITGEMDSTTAGSCPQKIVLPRIPACQAFASNDKSHVVQDGDMQKVKNWYSRPCPLSCLRQCPEPYVIDLYLPQLLQEWLHFQTLSPSCGADRFRPHNPFFCIKRWRL